MHKCINQSIGNVYHLEQMVDNFFPYSQKQLQFDKPVEIIFQSDDGNANKMLGKTAFYDPENMQVVLFVDKRHPKDVLRSLSHELVHHAQNCRGDLGGCDKQGWEPGLANGNAVCTKDTGVGYAQRDPHMRGMEREAYTKGNLIFRDFEDLIKTGKITIDIDFKESGEPKMSLKEWKNNEINTKLMKKWGFLTEGTAEERESDNQRGNQKVSMEDAEDLEEGFADVPPDDETDVPASPVLDRRAIAQASANAPKPTPKPGRLGAAGGRRARAASAGSKNVFTTEGDASGKISVREAKEITRRIIARIRKEGN